ncbi:hypothetical protein WDU99_01830 [Microbacterium sp. Mu-80]|uniref:DUF3168 domain-containing protein n=1 Tax=Microbacterium bandirmense TaxID=3122050 RepID=A0ABU8L6V2_9MICO
MSSFYPSAGAAVATVKRTILDTAAAALTAAGESEVDIGMGFVWPPKWQDSVSVGAVRESPTDGTIGMQRRQHVDIRQDVAITVQRETGSEEEVHDRAYHLLDVIDAAIRTDPTLGGAVLWCYSDEVASDGITDESDAGWGRICALSVTFVSRAMITRPA